MYLICYVSKYKHQNRTFYKINFIITIVMNIVNSREGDGGMGVGS